MRRKNWKSGVSLLMAAAMVMGSVSFAGPVKAEAAEGKAVGTTYYIDPAGDDSNSGTSEEQAWATFANLDTLTLGAGDQVLLKAGATWNLTAETGPFEISGATGTETAPVIIGKYGEGADPIINGNGSPWNTNVSAPKEDVAAVHVEDSQYITIQNLEVTNWEEDAADLVTETQVPNKADAEGQKNPKYRQSKYLLTGILVENSDAGELPGVVIKDNYVHKVNGYMQGGANKGVGGIMVLVTGSTTESSYKDLQIIGNKVENVCHEGIYMESSWAARPLVGGANSQDAGKNKWVGWKDMYVAHNYVNEVAGDGIVLINADNGIAEYNLVTASASEDWNFARNPAHAAIWMWDCNNVTMRYNEAAYTESYQDGMAFDCDYGNQNVMYEYNYSHDNKGGFWMACPGPYYTVNSVVRYNVSVNDGLFDGSRIIHVGESGSVGHQVYNNTVYWNTGYDVRAVEQGTWTSNNGSTPYTSGTDIYNNILYGNSGTFENHDGIHYDSNCVWGGAKDDYPVNEDVNAVIADPLLTNVKDYTAGSFANGKVTLGTVNGFTLKNNSPCIDAGRTYMPVPEEKVDACADDMNGVKTQITLPTVDYAKNAAPYQGGTVDIGAFEYQGAAEPVLADKAYLKALIDMADGYKAADFTPDTWAPMIKTLDGAKAMLNRVNAAQEQIDAVTAKLEGALNGLKKASDIKENTAADDTLAAYNSSDTIDNSGFEKSSSNWGKWPNSVQAAVSTEQKHSGNQSWKVAGGSSGSTAYSEIGGVPVKENTEYVCEAWVYYGSEAASGVGMEAKHHNSVTGGSDIKLANKNATGAKDSSGWEKIVMEFTTKGYNKISLSIGSTISTAYLDDVVLYEKYTISETVLDKTEIETTLAVAPKYKAEDYTEESWAAYQEAYEAAKLESVNALATQDSINEAAAKLQKAYNNLLKKANKTVLSALYKKYAAEKRGNYNNQSWQAFQTALKKAKAALDNKNAIQSQVDTALTALRKAHNALASWKNQSISYTKSYTKAYGNKAFKLNVKVKAGNKKLTYATTNKKVATVTSAGTVTLKGVGTCQIKVVAPGTNTYSGKSMTVTIKVLPGAASLKSLKTVKGRKLNVTYKKTTKATGYQIQYSTSKNFKSGTKTVTKKGTSATLSKLKKGKKYYVRVRAYTNVKSGKRTVKMYGSWSKAKVSGKIK